MRSSTSTTGQLPETSRPTMAPRRFQAGPPTRIDPPLPLPPVPLVPSWEDVPHSPPVHDSPQLFVQAEVHVPHEEQDPPVHALPQLSVQ
jgi:hypothetical protein